MPDVTMPNGDLVNFPDDMPKERIAGLIASKFPEVREKAKFGSKQYALETIEGLGNGINTGVTFGLNDEIQAGAAAASVGLQNLLGMDTGGLKAGEAYDQALNDFRNQSKQAKVNSPIASGVGEVAGAITTGAGLAKYAPAIIKGGTGGSALQGAIAGGLRGAGTGAVSGGLYAFGTGEGGASSRLGNAAIGAALGGGIGGVAGSVGGAISNSLAARAARLLEVKRAAQTPTAPSMTGGQAAAPVGVQSTAIQRVVEKLRKDYPDEAQFQEVLKRLQSGQVTLAELGGEATQDLALGAAQYPSGKGVTNEFFQGKPAGIGEAPVGGAISDARQNVTNSIEKNISGNTDFLGTLDDVYKSGVKKAQPFYEKAFSAKPINSDRIQEFLAQPELKTGIGKGLKIQRLEAVAEGKPFNPMDYGVTGFNEAGDPILGKVPNMRLLDAGKRGLDAMISEQTDPVTGRVTELGRALIQTKQSYVNELKALNPDYQAALDSAGDYLTMSGAMRAGREFKGNAKQIARDFAKLKGGDKEAYLIGVADNVRTMVDKVRDNGNAYNKIFGTPETRAKLKAVLPEKQFKQLSDDLWASDRIYTLRNKVLGNSTTASKQLSAQEFASPENEVLQELARGRPVAAGLNGVTQWVKKGFDGLSDKDAGEVARILLAKDETAKLKIIRQISDKIDPKAAAKTLPESKQLQTYFQIQDMIKPYRTLPLAGSAGVLATQPLRITVPTNYNPSGYEGTPPEVDLPTMGKK